MSNELKFHVFRYHLHPLFNKGQEIDGKHKTAEELKENKNNILSNVLQELDFYKNNNNIIKIEFKENGYFICKISNKKYIEHVANFKVNVIQNEPFVYVLINNNPNVQKIAISENKTAFGDPKTVKNILDKVLNKKLSKQGIGIKIEKLFRKETFWKIVSENKIASIKFRYIKPNLANISSSLSNTLKGIANDLNSHENELIFKAHSNSHLEINPTNSEIKGLVDYTAEGAGDIKIRMRGKKGYLSTNNEPVTVKVGEVEIIGEKKNVLEILDKILS